MYKIPIRSDNNNYGVLGNTMIEFGEFQTLGGNAGTTEIVNVTFPEAFDSTPIVIPTFTGFNPYFDERNITVANKSATGFTAYVLCMTDDAQTINYLAIGEKADEN